LSRRRIGDPDPLARIIDERLLPGDVVLAHHRGQPPFEATQQIAEAADMWTTTYQPLCCGPAYVAEPSERAGLPGMNRNISSSGSVGDYRAFRNVISEGSGRCHGLVCTPDISTRASAFAFISMSTSA